MKKSIIFLLLMSLFIIVITPSNIYADQNSLMRDFEKKHQLDIDRNSDTITGIINNLITIVQGIAQIITVIAQNFDDIISNNNCNNHNTSTCNNDCGNTPPSNDVVITQPDTSQPVTTEPVSEPVDGSKKYVVLECGAYTGNHSLNHGDVPVFINAMNRTGRSLYRHEKDYRVEKKDFNPEIPVEFVYYAGHGYNGYATLSSGKAFRPRDFYKKNNVENFVFACCKTVNSDWVNAFKNSKLKTVVGYWGTSYNGYVQNDVTKKFVQNISTIDTSNSLMVIKAWKDANNTGHSWTRKWGAAGLGNDGRARYFTINRVSLYDRTPERSVREDNKYKTLIVGSKRNINISDRVLSRASSVKRGIRQNDSLSEVKSEKEKMRFNKQRSLFSGNREYQVINMPSGALIIRANDLSMDNVKINETDALEQAYEFIKENGGIPDGMKFETISREKIESNGKENVIGYTIEFVHEFNGVQVVSNDGEGIKISIDSKGINYYQRMWTDLKEVQAKRSASSRKIISIEDAIKKASKELLKIYISDSDINIISVEKGYYTGDLYQLKEEPDKVYIVKTDSEDVFYIDIYTGQMIR